MNHCQIWNVLSPNGFFCVTFLGLGQEGFFHACPSDLEMLESFEPICLHNVFENAMWKKIIIGASGEMRDANTQFMGNLALAEMPVEYVTNLIKAHCIGKPQNLHSPLKFHKPPEMYSIPNFSRIH